MNRRVFTNEPRNAFVIVHTAARIGHPHNLILHKFRQLLPVGLNLPNYFIVIALVIQMGLSTTDLKLFQALTVAVFLSLPNIRRWIGRVLVNSVKGGKH